MVRSPVCFLPLLEEASREEWKSWRSVLEHLALLHEISRHPAFPPATSDFETLGTGYYFNPAFGHWDLTYSLLDSCPVMPEHTEQQLENLFAFQREDGFMRGVILFRGKYGNQARASPAETPRSCNAFRYTSGAGLPCSTSSEVTKAALMKASVWRKPLLSDALAALMRQVTCACFMNTRPVTWNNADAAARSSVTNAPCSMRSFKNSFSWRKPDFSMMN